MSNIRKSIKISKREKKKYHCKPLRSLLKAPQRKGTAMKFRIVSPKKPNSAKRRIVRIILTNRYWVTAKIKGIGHTLQVYSEVLACGGRANDLPGVRYNMIKGGSYGFSYKESFVRKNSLSKYGWTVDDRYFAIEEENEKKLEFLNQQEVMSDEEVDYINNSNLNFPLMMNQYAEFGDAIKNEKKFSKFNK